MDNPKPDRLRQHPEPRFAGPQHLFDLDAMAKKLQQEANAGEAGRRQQTLFKQGPISVSLFIFGRLTRLAAHRANGVVTIHTLTGRLQVTTEDQTHDLRAGSLLVLGAGVQHDVVALEESQMLLTVNLEARPAGAADSAVPDRP